MLPSSVQSAFACSTVNATCPGLMFLSFFSLSAWIHSGRVKLCYGIYPSSGVISLEVYLFAKSSYGNINCTLQAEDSDSVFFLGITDF